MTFSQFLYSELRDIEDRNRRVAARTARIRQALNDLARNLKLQHLDGVFGSDFQDIGQRVYGYVNDDSIRFYVYNREDLTQLLTLAPLWAKDKRDDGIQYKAELFSMAGTYGSDTVPFNIILIAKDDALPPTCKIETYEEVIPARAEERHTRTRVVCDFATDRN